MATNRYFNVMNPVKGKDGKTRFNRMGVAFLNEGTTDPETGEVTEAKAFMSLKLDAFPRNGELVLFAPKPGEDDGSAD
ncbi:MAG: hypothetical protein KGK00_00220 [Paracoccaceae bacterium]|nr:hypothetical protein [Paracoccaceae bacterium]MDE3238930.1 hypothetical protein [Paracoccaceae bacterium]